jgi:hypothetical protein
VRGALGGAAVAAAVGLLAWGAGARDLSGDELHMLGGGAWAAVAAAYAPITDPGAPAWGHLPWAYAARALSVGLLGPELRLGWRLPSLIAALLTVALVGEAGARLGGRGAGLTAAVAAAIDPVLAAHAHEASNYAWSALCASLTLRGAWGQRAGWPLAGPSLAAGLCIGCANDLYFVVPMALAALISLGTRPRGAALRAWGPALLVSAPLAALVGLRMLTAPAALEAHGDPGQAPDLVVLGLLRRFFGAHLLGYAHGRLPAPWEAWPALILGAAVIAAAARRPAARPVALGLCLGLAAAAAGVAAVALMTGRSPPLEPRITIGLTPLWALALGLVGARATLLLPLLGTLEARLDPADGQARALADAVQDRAGDELLVLPPPFGHPALPLPAGAAPCADGPPPALSISARPDGLPEPCPGAAPLDPGPPRWVRRYGPPDHERNGAAFFPTWTVARWGGAPPPGPRSAVEITVARALLDGVDGGALVASAGDEAARADGPHLRWADRPTGAPLELRVMGRAPPGLPSSPLFDPFTRELQAWEPLPWTPEPQIHVQARPLRSPWVALLRRLGPLLAAAALLVPWLRRPR